MPLLHAFDFDFAARILLSSSNLIGEVCPFLTLIPVQTRLAGVLNQLVAHRAGQRRLSNRRSWSRACRVRREGDLHLISS